MDLKVRDNGKLKAGMDKIGPWGSRRTSEVIESMVGGIHPLWYQLILIRVLPKHTSIEIALWC